MARLAEAEGTAARALAFAILTASRTGEVIGMTWDEVDFDKAVWTVPAVRMKMGRPHSVPLSAAALAIVKGQLEMRTASMSGPHPYVFPSPLPKRPLSNMALAMLLRRLGVESTVRGFRSSFRDWCADNAIAFAVAESALAHAPGSSVVQAYMRSSMLERRRPVMAAWADFLAGETAKVVPLRRGRR